MISLSRMLLRSFITGAGIKCDPDKSKSRVGIFTASCEWLMIPFLSESAKMSKRLADFLWKCWYPWLTRLTKHSPVNLLNYGYTSDAMQEHLLPLSDMDEPDRACIQLYHRVVCPINLTGLSVLEVSCGHGGGASYIARYLKPKTLHGLDRNARAVRRCQRQHDVIGLSFSCGNAMDLCFGESTFDVVINIEASHCYPDVPRFFSEVRRVLRPGGHFLYADFRQADPDRAILEDQLKQSGLDLCSCEDISANVVRGMQLNTEKYLELIRRLLPRLLRKPAMNFAGVKGSTIYKELESGQTIYLAYHLRKPMTQSRN